MPRIWFERVPPPPVVATLPESIEIIEHDDGFDRIEDAELVIAGRLPYDAAVIARARRAWAICRTGIGTDRVDVDAATEAGIVVCNAPDAPTQSTAEHTWALLFAVTKRLDRIRARHRRGEPDLYRTHDALELGGRTLGLVGFGRVARKVAAIARAIPMNVAAHDPFVSDRAFAEAQVSRVAELDDLLGRADVVSLHVPFTANTRRLIGARELETMRPGSILINTARGELVDHDALLDALDRGHLAGAGLDVTVPEPLPPDHPLSLRDDVVVTPHVATATDRARIGLMEAAVANALAVAQGRRPPDIVNPEVWERRRVHVT